MATSIVIALTVAMFAFSATIKLAGLRQSLEIRDHLAIAPDAWRVIGMLELAGAIGVLLGLALWPPIGYVAAAGLVLVGLGATRAHLRVGDGLAPIATALAAAALALAALVLLVSST